MGRLILIELTTPELRAQTKERINKMIDEMPDGEYIGDIKKNLPIRSIKANKFFHAVCNVYAIYTGHTMQEIKDEFKRDRFFEMRVDKQGREYKHLKETSGLDTKEYASVCNNLLQWGREKHPEITIERQEDMDYQRWMEIENEYNRVFSGF